jgi:HEPN domain-containing protein
MSSKIDCEKIVAHWIEASDNDFNTMLILHSAKSYHWALFMRYITIERLLKAYYVKKERTHAPFTHNLYRLAELSGLDWLYRITTFNLNARYE